MSIAADEPRPGDDDEPEAERPARRDPDEDSRDPGPYRRAPIDPPDALAASRDPDDDDTRDPGEGEVPDLSPPFLTAGIDFETGDGEDWDDTRDPGDEDDG